LIVAQRTVGESHETIYGERIDQATARNLNRGVEIATLLRLTW
jgi:hypothetical protein